MHEPGNILPLRFENPGFHEPARSPHQLTFCYQCHCAVDLRVTARAALRSGHWARMGTCPHCGTTVTRIIRGSAA
jgi:hypothetical protein